MSAFLGAAGLSAGIIGSFLYESDERNMPNYHQWAFCTERATQEPFGNGVLWPNSRGMGGQLSGSITNDATTDSGIFELQVVVDDPGGSQVKKIIGTTLDSAGNPLGSCMVQGYVTATDIFVGQVTSDSGGYYELPTTKAGQQHYLTAYKAGSPDTAGTSVNTIVPT